ncbi:hypothetical protein CW703_05355 [Candidatus Bathyarchaeota archaeon]|nr:MAG: hypothetical protein CW703_05355 [Candidatus Bathyarchaeota archaeon]
MKPWIEWVRRAEICLKIAERVDEVFRFMETSTIILDAVLEGKPIFDGLNLWEKLQLNLKKLFDKGWRKKDFGWIIPSLKG